MDSPRFLGSRVYFWLVVPWVVMGIVTFALVARGSFEDGRPMAGVAASYFAFLCALGTYAMLTKKHGLACGRIVAGTVALAYVAYFVGTFFIERQSLMPTGRRSDSTPFNAIWGFVVIGLPCAQFAITAFLSGACGRKQSRTSRSSTTRAALRLRTIHPQPKLHPRSARVADLWSFGMRDETADIYARVHNRVDEILHYLWDPIGVAGSAGARDEYDSYVPTVVKMLFDGADVEAIAKYLHSVETESMGLSTFGGRAKKTSDAAKTVMSHFQWIQQVRRP